MRAGIPHHVFWKGSSLEGMEKPRRWYYLADLQRERRGEELKAERIHAASGGGGGGHRVPWGLGGGGGGATAGSCLDREGALAAGWHRQ
jgi:hypothetical protein